MPQWDSFLVWHSMKWNYPLEAEMPLRYCLQCILNGGREFTRPSIMKGWKKKTELLRYTTEIKAEDKVQGSFHLTSQHRVRHNDEWRKPDMQERTTVPSLWKMVTWTNQVIGVSQDSSHFQAQRGRILSGKGAEGVFYDAKNVLYLNLGSNFMNTFVKIHWAKHWRSGHFTLVISQK